MGPMFRTRRFSLSPLSLLALVPGPLPPLHLFRRRRLARHLCVGVEELEVFAEEDVVEVDVRCEELVCFLVEALFHFLASPLDFSLIAWIQGVSSLRGCVGIFGGIGVSLATVAI